LGASDDFKARVVQLILDGRVEEALDILAAFYRTSKPRVRVGVVKGRCQGIYGLYDPAHSTIYISRGDYLRDPLTVLHEFYHHLRYKDGKHRGNERYAERFAREYVEAYMKLHRTM
jgi:hypothetical protein